MLCNENIINDLRQEKYITFKADYKGQYDLCSKIGLLQIYNISNFYGYILIKIDSLDSKQYSNVLIEILSLGYDPIDSRMANHIPINQFISGSFNLRDYNKYNNIGYIITNKNKNDSIIIEFSKNYEGLQLEIDETKYKIENKDGFTKYIIKEYKNYILIFIRLINKNNYKNLLNANYMIRYYYDNNKYNDNDFKLSPKYQIKEYEVIGNKVRFLLEFKFDYIKNNNTNNLKYKIYYKLFLDDNINEILNTSAITLSNPINESYALIRNDYNKFDFNLTFIPNYNNYKYIMQIKVNIDNDDYYQKIGILTYSIPMDLTQYLKEGEKNENKKIILLFIFLGISVIIIIFIIIVFIILYNKIKKKNDILTDKILSISFSSEDKEHIHKQFNQEEDLNSTFI